VPGFDIAGKTGTTSDYRDAWFIGYSGGFTAAVWTGRDDDTPMRGVVGGGPPAEIWRAFMVPTLPHMNVEPIPGGPAPQPPAAPDVIGDILTGAPPNQSAAPATQSPPAAGAPPPPG
jgi:penicillin-binding protein 1A